MRPVAAGFGAAAFDEAIKRTSRFQLVNPHAGGVDVNIRARALNAVGAVILIAIHMAGKLPKRVILPIASRKMADNIRVRDASLRQALEQRTVMSREIHHRVKNNLQIVASLLQIESRRLAEPAAREALRVTHTRINAIALVHRILEEIDDRTVVNLKTLFNDLARSKPGTPNRSTALASIENLNAEIAAPPPVP